MPGWQSSSWGCWQHFALLLLLLTVFCSSWSSDSAWFSFPYRQCLALLLIVVCSSAADQCFALRDLLTACFARLLPTVFCDSSHSSLFLRCWQCFTLLLVVVFYALPFLLLLFALLLLTVVCSSFSSSDGGWLFFFFVWQWFAIHLLTVVCPFSSDWQWFALRFPDLGLAVLPLLWWSSALLLVVTCSLSYAVLHFFYFWQCFTVVFILMVFSSSSDSVLLPAIHPVAFFSHNFALNVFFFRQRFAVPLSCPLYRLVCHTHSRLSAWDSQPTNPRACSADVRALYTKKSGHSTGPKDPRSQKSSGAVKRIWCRQPASSNQ